MWWCGWTGTPCVSRTDALSPDRAVALVEAWLRFPTQETSVALLRAGLATAARHRLSYRDSTIVDGQQFDGVRVKNPFVGGEKP